MIKSTAQFLHGEFERNWACHEDPFYEQRRTNIDQRTTTSHRLVEGRMLEFARNYPEATSSFLRRAIQPNSNLSLAGAGSAHTAVTDGQQILKIHRLSTFMNDQAKVALNESMIAQHKVLRNHLGTMVIRQTTRVDSNPLRPRKKAVISTQPYINFEDLGIFDGYRSTIDQSVFESVKNKFPGITEALFDFANYGLQMHEKTGLLPDTSGLNNIVVADGELLCLDGLPIGSSKASDVERITAQLLTLKKLTK